MSLGLLPDSGDRRALRATPPPSLGIPLYPRVSQFGVSLRGAGPFHPCLAYTSATKARIGADFQWVLGLFWPRAKGQKPRAAFGCFAKYQEPSSQLLLSKIVRCTTFSPLERIPYFTICSPSCQAKSGRYDQVAVIMRLNACLSRQKIGRGKP